MWGSGGMELYVNGILEDSNSYTGTYQERNSWDWAIGRDTQVASGQYWNGTIDEVMIFNRGLSAEQVLAIYNNRTDLIVSQETSLGDVWQACITPNDGTEDGTEECSNDLTILLGDLPPTLILNNPDNNTWNTSRTINFTYTPSDDVGFSNCSVWTNSSGSWNYSQIH